MVAVQLAAAALGRARLSPRCECVFIDVGLNTGRSLSTWPRVLHEAHTSHELPHGLHARLGSCLERSKKVGARRCWYGFEANPRYTEALRGIEWRMRRRGEREVVLHTGTAFGTSWRPSTFYVDSESRGLGSTLEASAQHVSFNASRPSMQRFLVDPNRTVRETYTPLTTASTDAGEWLAAVAANASGTALIALKLDVEGYEYKLLDHLLRRHARSLCRIDLLAVEWHERKMPSAVGESERLKRRIRRSAADRCAGRTTAVLDWE